MTVLTFLTIMLHNGYDQGFLLLIVKLIESIVDIGFIIRFKHGHALIQRVIDQIRQRQQIQIIALDDVLKRYMKIDRGSRTIMRHEQPGGGQDGRQGWRKAEPPTPGSAGDGKRFASH